jgi:hypothetical protein
MIIESHNDRVRVGEFPLCADVSVNASFSVVTAEFRLPAFLTSGTPARVQVRRKDGRLAVIVMERGDSGIPEEWQDAEVLHEFTKRP